MLPNGSAGLVEENGSALGGPPKISALEAKGCDDAVVGFTAPRKSSSFCPVLTAWPPIPENIAFVTYGFGYPNISDIFSPVEPCPGYESGRDGNRCCSIWSSSLLTVDMSS